MSETLKTNPTIWDVARVAGVSQTTVSLALRGATGVSEKRAAQIRKIAKKMNYQPKIAAQMMRAKRVRQLGLIVPCEDIEALAQTGHSMPIMVHFVEQCDKRSVRYHIEFAKTQDKSNFTLPIQLSGQMVDGVVLGGYVDPELLNWLKNQTQYPWVHIDEASDYCALSALDTGVSEAVQHLAALGHRDIAFECGPTVYKNHQLSLEGFNRAVKEYSLNEIKLDQKHDLYTPTRSERMMQAVRWAEQLLSMPKRPTAIVCSSIMAARGIVHAASGLRLSVPKDVSIIAIGPASFAETTLPFISTIEQDFKSLAEKALDLLESRIADREGVMPQTQWVRTNLVMRDSVTKPNID